MSVHSSLYYPDPTKLFPSLRGPPDSSYSRSQTCGFQNSYSKDNSGLNPARDPAVMAFRRTLRPHKKGLALHWTGDEETFLPLLASTPCQHSQQDWIVIFPNTRVFSNRVRKRLDLLVNSLSKWPVGIKKESKEVRHPYNAVAVHTAGDQCFHTRSPHETQRAKLPTLDSVASVGFKHWYQLRPQPQTCSLPPVRHTLSP